jgi:ACS family hexuronate transporter-like MFS transporter
MSQSITQPVAARDEALPPVHRQVRWWILGLLFLVTVINFVDRLTLSYVAPVLKDTFRLSNENYGDIVSWFIFGMMIGEFPMGRLMDRRGPRFGFTFAVIWWSIANALHAFARTIFQFSALRFWMGTGECGNYSGGVKVIGQWFPPQERAFATGVMNGASLVGNMITPPIIVFIMAQLGWKAAFLIPSLLGMLWVVAWRAYYCAPEKHRHLTAAELKYIQESEPESSEAEPSTWQLLKLRQTWAVMLCRLLVGPVIQFYLFWLPLYLSKTRGYTLALIGVMGILPPLFGDLGSIGGGWITGKLMSAGLTTDRARRVVMFAGAGLCALSIVVVSSSVPFIWWSAICLVYLGHYALSANMFAAISDLFPNNATARVTALTGIAGGLSGWLFPKLTGRLVDQGSYTPVFTLAAFMPLAGVLALFLLAGKLKRVELQTKSP